MTDKGFPDCWLKIEVGKISLVISGGTPKANNPANFKKSGEGVAWITPADLSGYKKKGISNGKRDLTQQGYDSCSAKLLPKGSILFSSRAPIGYVVIAKNEMATNQGFKSFVFPDGVETDYAYYYFNHIVDIAKSVASGTTFKELSATKARKLSFLLAPFDEQKEIASRLDILLRQVDNLKSRIDAIPNIIKQFRESVLSDAISGVLTEGWRKENTNNVEIVCLGDVGTLMGGSTPSKANSAYWTNGSIPWVSPKDMKVIEISSSIDKVTKQALSDKRVKLIPSKSILMVTRSGILSHLFPVALTTVEVTINQDIKAFIPNQNKIHPNFSSILLRGHAKEFYLVAPNQAQQFQVLRHQNY